MADLDRNIITDDKFCIINLSVTMEILPWIQYLKANMLGDVQCRVEHMSSTMWNKGMSCSSYQGRGEMWWRGMYTKWVVLLEVNSVEHNYILYPQVENDP